MPPTYDPERLCSRIRNASPIIVEGRVNSLVGLTITAKIPGLRVGETVSIARREGRPLLAEVRGFKNSEAILVPLGDVQGLGPSDLVRQIGLNFSFKCGTSLLGRVINGLGEPIDGKGPIKNGISWTIVRQPTPPLLRPRIQNRLSTGIRAIDTIFTIGEGQRLGLFSGSGVGKSTLLGQIARGTDADAIVVALVGERGREVREFLETALGDKGLSRSVVVCSTADEPALIRLRAALVATSVAEFFRDIGGRVLLLMDSVTRLARSQREVGLAAGEPPVRRGYPPSVFALLPQLMERTGTSPKGSITAIYTILVEGDDLDEPIADEVRGILDGHIVLSREAAQRGLWPPIDVPHSLSRLADHLVSGDHRKAAHLVRRWVSTFERVRHLVELGAYQPGSDPELDQAIFLNPRIEKFLAQEFSETINKDEAEKELFRLASA